MGVSSSSSVLYSFVAVGYTLMLSMLPLPSMMFIFSSFFLLPFRLWMLLPFFCSVFPSSARLLFIVFLQSNYCFHKQRVCKYEAMQCRMRARERRAKRKMITTAFCVIANWMRAAVKFDHYIIVICFCYFILQMFHITFVIYRRKKKQNGAKKKLV